MKPIGLAALVAVLGSWAALAAAQAETIERPQVKPGDTWTYRRIDFWTNKPTATIVASVTFANERAIQTLVKVTGQGVGPEGESDATATAEWNLVSSSTGAVYEPHSGHLRFPMRAGDTFQSKYRMTQPRQGAFRVDHDRKVTVVGWEDVTVPAGKFRALKIESAGSFDRIDTNLSGSAKDVIWYAPEVKRFVKWTYEDSTFRGRFNWWGFELVEYKVQ